MKFRKRVLPISILIIVLITNLVFAAIEPSELKSNTLNVAPTVDFSIALKKDLDLIIVTDYSGAQLNNIQSKINELKVAVSGRYKVNTYFIGADEISKQPDKITLATQNNQVATMTYYRYFHMNIYKTGYEDGSNGRVDWNNTYEDRKYAYEYVQLNEGQPLPPFQKSNNYVFGQTQYRMGYQGMGFAYIYDEYTVYDPNNVAATKINPQITVDMGMAGYHMVMGYSLISQSLDNVWSLGGISTSNQQNNYDAIKMDKINTLSLKPNSEKQVIFLTDNDNTKSYREWGNYYPFASAKTSNIGSFLDNNNCNVYAVATETALDIKVNQQSASLNSAVTQDFSLRELVGMAKGEQQVYDKGQFNSVVKHIEEKYSSTSNTNKIDIKIATDYTGTKFANFNTSLQVLKQNLQTKGIDVNLEYFTNKTPTSSILLKSKKISGDYDQTILLKENGDLYYYKAAITTRHSIVNPNLIYAQYPYSQDKITNQSYSRYIRAWDDYEYYPISAGYSFLSRAIPPILVEQGVTDAYMFDSSIIYQKNDTLYLTGNFSLGEAYDDYRTVAISNSSNIKKLYYIKSARMLYAVKNDGTLWAIGSNWPLFATGVSDWNNLPYEIKNGVRSCVLVKVGPSYFNEKIVDVVGENNFIAALTDKGEVYCWGSNYYGQFGNGSSYSFGVNGATDALYYSPFKMNISGITDIASSMGALYMIGTMGMVYHTGFAGYENEKYYVNSNPIYPANPMPVPGYINKSNYNKYRYLTNDNTYTLYYACTIYTTYPTALTYNGNVVTGATKFTKTEEALQGYGASIYGLTSSITVDVNHARMQSQINLNTNDNYYWSAYPYQERQNKINDYLNSYNKYFDVTNKSKVMLFTQHNVPPIGYSIVTNAGDVLDNVNGYSSAEYYNNPSAQTAATLLQLYNLTTANVLAKLNETTSYAIQNLDVNQIVSSTTRSDSIKYFIYASDTQGEVTKDNLNNYISLSYLPESFKQYLVNNGFINAIVTPTVNRDLANMQTLLGINTGIYASVENVKKAINDKYNPSSDSSASYLIVNEDEIYYKGAYIDYESDPAYKEEFYYDHDASVFENNTGQISNNIQWINTTITKFTKKGKYTIKYRVQDNPSILNAFANYRKWSNESTCTIYVHERPFALTNITITPNGSYYRITANDGGSYDNDHLSIADKGIVAHEWRWKESTELSWHSELINVTNATMGNVYQVQHRVQDIEGAWSDWKDTTIDNTRPPIAQYTLDKSTITTQEKLKVKDTSIAYFGNLTNWQWIIVNKSDDSVISKNQYTNSNTDIGGYDKNVKTNYSDVGPGSYRIYLRVKANNGLWSDGGTDALIGYNLGNCYYRDITVEEAFILEKFRVVLVRDLQLEDYYYNRATGKYDDKPMYVNDMALDSVNFGTITNGLTKGYMFEFEIDSTNFNDSSDSIVIEPHFYTTDAFARDAAERDIYWEDSNHQIHKVGEGGHSAWKTIMLTALNRTMKADEEATWRGEYLIPGTAWAVPKGTLKSEAKAKDLKLDIIVNFHIKGYKDGILQFNYNEEQWDKERIVDKYPYLIGDVIRYGWDKNCLNDIKAKDNR